MKKLSTKLLVLGLMLLLLVSPCKVRNFIQAELDVPQTEVTSKNKSARIQLHCSEAQVATSILAKEIFSSQHLPIIASKVGGTFYNADFSLQPIPLYGKNNRGDSNVPLYILYQNFKDYL